MLIENVSLQLKFVSKSKSKRKKLITKNLKECELESSIIKQELSIKSSYTLLQRMRFVNRKVAQNTLRRIFFLYNDILNYNISVKFLIILKSNFD